MQNFYIKQSAIYKGKKGKRTSFFDYNYKPEMIMLSAMLSQVSFDLVPVAPYVKVIFISSFDVTG